MKYRNSYSTGVISKKDQVLTDVYNFLVSSFWGASGLPLPTSLAEWMHFTTAVSRNQGYLLLSCAEASTLLQGILWTDLKWLSDDPWETHTFLVLTDWECRLIPVQPSLLWLACQLLGSGYFRQETSASQLCVPTLLDMYQTHCMTQSTEDFLTRFFLQRNLHTSSQPHSQCRYTLDMNEESKSPLSSS